MSDDTPIMAHEVTSLATELRAVHRELRELRGDIRTYRNEAAGLRVDLAVAQRDIIAAHRRLDESARSDVERSKPWQGVLPSVVVAVIVGSLCFGGQAVVANMNAPVPKARP